jgi:hypothetical protein
MQDTIHYGSQLQARHSGSFIFVVSHMRSYSSLLCHILGSHPEISGYAEAHQSYFGRIGLNRLATKVRATTGNPALGRYVLDKILHNHFQIAPNILGRPNVKVLFLIRTAEDTITSILNMWHALGQMDRFGDPEHVLNYYVTRLQQINAYSEQLARDALLIASERLMTDTAATLDGISQWLNLDRPLAANYQTFKFTGSPGYGDPSPNIMAGKVVTDAAERHRSYARISVPEDVFTRGNAAYAAHWENLAARSDVR